MGAMAVAWNALTGVWFTGAFTQNGAVVFSDVTLQDLAHHGLIQAPTGAVPVTYSIGGLPAPKAWLIAAAAMTALAVVLRMSLFSLISVILMWISRASAVAAEKTLMSEAAGGRFTRQGFDFVNFINMSWVAMALGTLLSIQLTYAVAVERRIKERRGEEAPGGVLDAVQGVGESFVNRFNRPAPNDTRSPAREAQPTR
jgi:hypothetical protein